jgi:chromosome segregation ATPase
MPTLTRSSRFTQSECLTLVQVVAELRPYAAPHGQTEQRWAAVAVALEEHQVSGKTWRQCKQRFFRIVDEYRASERESARGTATPYATEYASVTRQMQQIAAEMDVLNARAASSRAGQAQEQQRRETAEQRRTEHRERMTSGAELSESLEDSPASGSAGGANGGSPVPAYPTTPTLQTAVQPIQLAQQSTVRPASSLEARIEAQRSRARARNTRAIDYSEVLDTIRQREHSSSRLTDSMYADFKTLVEERGALKLRLDLVKEECETLKGENAHLKHENAYLKEQLGQADDRLQYDSAVQE